MIPTSCYDWCCTKLLLGFHLLVFNKNTSVDVLKFGLNFGVLNTFNVMNTFYKSNKVFSVTFAEFKDIHEEFLFIIGISLSSFVSKFRVYFPFQSILVLAIHVGGSRPMKHTLGEGQGLLSVVKPLNRGLVP